MKLRYLNGFHLFKKAFKKTRREIAVSLWVLALLTFAFAISMWAAEKSANSEYSFVDAMVWVIVKYVEDPADVVMAPATILGQITGTLVGILGIAIFAVPAGLLGSGLMDAMDDDRKEEELEANSKRLHKRFRRIAQSSSWFYNSKGTKTTLKFVPRYRTLEHIMVKTGMNQEEIFDAVNNCPDMRLMNLGVTQRNELADRVVVAHFPLNNEYGCFINRESDVTIVAPVAVTEIGTGSFAYSLAAMGGFNYVSKELTPNPDDPFGFYSMRKSNLTLVGDYNMKEDVESQALHFMNDLKTLRDASIAKGRRHWFIFLLGTSKTDECQVHFWRQAVGDKSLVVAEDEVLLQNIFVGVRETLAQRSVEVRGESRTITTCLDNHNVLKRVDSSNIMCRMGGGTECNALTLRVGFEILVYHSSHLLIARDIATVIKAQIEPGKTIPEEARRSYLVEGDGYADEYGKCDIFEQDPERLRAMIENANRAARRKYEKYDLDGNLEAR